MHDVAVMMLSDWEKIVCEDCCAFGVTSSLLLAIVMENKFVNDFGPDLILNRR